MPVSEFIDRSHALEYIKKKGYASYSSIKNVRDANIPGSFYGEWLAFGNELHSRWLEKLKRKRLTGAEERLLNLMIAALKKHVIAKRLIKGAAFEQKFAVELYGVVVLGYIDVLANHVADLKSTRHTSMKRFVDEMDFLQAALYLAVTKKKDFYYIGISKVFPYSVFVFNVRDYPERLMAAQCELKYWLTYIKRKI